MYKLNNLQGLKFIGFLLIFLNHSWWFLGIGKVFDFGARGIEIFFALSGYLVAYNYADKDLDSSIKGTLNYAYKKLRKFYILHIVTFVCFFIIPFKNLLKGALNEQQIKELMLNSVLNITLLKSWYSPAKFSFNAATWFLCSIMFAYLLVPKMVVFFKNREKKFYIITFLVVFIWKMVLDTWFYKFPHSFYVFNLYANPAYRFLDFLLGFLFYLTIGKDACLLKHYWVNWLQVSVIGIYAFSCFKFDKVWIPASYILLALMVIYVCTLKYGMLDFILGNKWIVQLGNINLELFILHDLVLIFFNKINLKLLNGYIQKPYFWCLALVMSVLVSFGVNKFISKCKLKRGVD